MSPRIVNAPVCTTAPLAVWDGYVDSWTPTYPNGAVSGRICTVTATDRFKVLARRQNTGSTVATTRPSVVRSSMLRMSVPVLETAAATSA